MAEDQAKQKESETEKNEAAEPENLRSAFERCEREKQEFLELAQRMKADFLNLKKDQERQAMELRKFAQEELLRKLLIVLDSFELAFKQIPEEVGGNGWVSGIKNIKGQLNDLIKNAGVREIVSIGWKFDPYLHEAVAYEELPDKEDGEIMEELQKGYKLHDKVIRAAKVKVAVKKV